MKYNQIKVEAGRAWPDHPELWKPISGYEGLYEISNHGRVASLERIIVRGRINQLLPYRIIKAKKGIKYPFVKLSKLAVRTNITIHRLVALHFIELVEGKPQVNHIDGNKENNFYKNLEWCDSFENMNHALQNRLIHQKITPKETKQSIIDLADSGVQLKDISIITKTPKRTISGLLKKHRDGKNIIY